MARVKRAAGSWADLPPDLAPPDKRIEVKTVAVVELRADELSRK